MRLEEIRTGQLVYAVYGPFRGEVYYRLGEILGLTAKGRVSLGFERGRRSALLPENLIAVELVPTAWGQLPLGPA